MHFDSSFIFENLFLYYRHALCSVVSEKLYGVIVDYLSAGNYGNCGGAGYRQLCKNFADCVVHRYTLLGAEYCLSDSTRRYAPPDLGGFFFYRCSFFYGNEGVSEPF